MFSFPSGFIDCLLSLALVYILVDSKPSSFYFQFFSLQLDLRMCVFTSCVYSGRLNPALIRITWGLLKVWSGSFLPFLNTSNDAIKRCVCFLVWLLIAEKPWCLPWKCTSWAVSACCFCVDNLLLSFLVFLSLVRMWFYTHNGILFSFQKEWNSDIWMNPKDIACQGT